MHEDHEKVRRDWRIPDELWEPIEPRLPARKPHPLGCHRPRVEERQAMDAIFSVLRTGGHWKALHHPSLCSSSSAHRRVQEWTAAGVFLELWRRGLMAYAAVKGIDWAWLAMDGAMTQAPRGGENRGQEPTRPRHERHPAPRAHRRRWRTARSGSRGRQSP
jgi:transposase